jgi:hypothetical protein
LRWKGGPQDLTESKAFFSALGFGFSDDNGGNEGLSMMHVGSDRHVVNLIKNAAFEKASQSQVAGPGDGSEVLISIDAAGKREIDAIAEKVIKAGGRVFSAPQDFDGWCNCGALPDRPNQ